MKDILQIILREFLGRQYEELDCFDVAVKFYKLVYKTDISFLRQPELSRRNNIQNGKSWFKKVEEPKIGDIVLLDDFGIEAHIGIYLFERLILHSTKKKGVVIERLKHRGYYRWQE